MTSRRPKVRTARALPVTAVALMLGGLSTASSTTAATADGGAFGLRAAAMHTSGLTYVGTVTVSTANAGDVAVLRFAADAATVTTLVVTPPCSAARTITSTASSAALTGVALDATSFAATVGGVRTTWTVANAPPGAFPASLELADVDVVALTLTVAHAEDNGLHTSVAAC